MLSRNVLTFGKSTSSLIVNVGTLCLVFCVCRYLFLKRKYAKILGHPFYFLYIYTLSGALRTLIKKEISYT
jgi:hypothetical protein